MRSLRLCLFPPALLRSLRSLLRHASLVVKVLALLVGMPFMLATPGQVKVGTSASVQRDEQVRAEIPVPNVYLGPRQLFLQADKRTEQEQGTIYLQQKHG